jgi:hypothetical protein
LSNAGRGRVVLLQWQLKQFLKQFLNQLLTLRQLLPHLSHIHLCALLSQPQRMPSLLRLLQHILQMPQLTMCHLKILQRLLGEAQGRGGHHYAMVRIKIFFPKQVLMGFDAVTLHIARLRIAFINKVISELQNRINLHIKMSHEFNEYKIIYEYKPEKQIIIENIHKYKQLI